MALCCVAAVQSSAQSPKPTPGRADADRAVPISGVPETAEEDAQSPEQASEYDRLVLSALAAFKAGEWTRARGLFERAHALQPTARTLRTIGMAAFNQGDLVGAVQNLEASLSDDRKPLTVEQQEHVRQLIHRADGRLGRLRLIVRPAGADVTVDGKAPDFIGGDQLVLEPGRHELRVQAPGHRARVQHVRVSARDRATLEIQLEPGADDPAAAVQVATAPTPMPGNAPTPAHAQDDSGNWAPWVAIGLGAAGIATAAVVGGLAYGRRGDLDDTCPGRECPPPSHDDVDSYNQLRATSLVALGIGIVGLGLGATLLALDDDSSEHASLEAQVGLGWVQLRGSL